MEKEIMAIAIAIAAMCGVAAENVKVEFDKAKAAAFADMNQ